MNDEETNSGAAAETSIAISVEDKKYIDQIRQGMSKKEKLHQIIESFRHPPDPRDYPR